MADTATAEETYWHIRELFPDTSPRWIREQAEQGKDSNELSEMILDGEAPAKDEAEKEEDRKLADAISQPDEVMEEDSFALLRGRAGSFLPGALPPAPIRTNFQPRPVVVATVSVVSPASAPNLTSIMHSFPTDRPSFSCMEVVEDIPDIRDEPERPPRNMPCSVCGSSREIPKEAALCHPKGCDPDGESHCICNSCINMRCLRNKIKILDDKSALRCLAKKCARVIDRNDLIDMGKGSLAGTIFGVNDVPLSTPRTLAEKLKDMRHTWEEPPLTAAEREQYSTILQYQDEERYSEIAALLPTVAHDWLLQHAGYGTDALLEEKEKQGMQVPQRKRKRTDGKGVTSLVEEAFRSQRTFDCSICFEIVPLHAAIHCSYVGGLDGDVSDLHSFCHKCVVGHAQACTEQYVIHSTGEGIKCMETDCKNVLLLAHIEQVIPADVRLQLDPRINEAAIRSAAVENFEKCQRCDWGAIMELSKEDASVFKCDNCQFQYCRLCDREYNKYHAGKTCEELDPEAMRKKMEEKLTTTVMKKCPNCHRGYEKTHGCNKIECPSCHTLSCFVCGMQINGYEHFTQTGCPQNDDGRTTVATEQRRQQTLQQGINTADPEVARAFEGLR